MSKTQFRAAVIENGVVTNMIVADLDFSYPEGSAKTVVPVCELCPKGIAYVNRIEAFRPREDVPEVEPRIGDRYADGKFSRPPVDPEHLKELARGVVEEKRNRDLIRVGDLLFAATTESLAAWRGAYDASMMFPDDAVPVLTRSIAEKVQPDEVKKIWTALITKDRELKLLEFDLMEAIEKGELTLEIDVERAAEQK